MWLAMLQRSFAGPPLTLLANCPLLFPFLKVSMGKKTPLCRTRMAVNRQLARSTHGPLTEGALPMREFARGQNYNKPSSRNWRRIGSGMLVMPCATRSRSGGASFAAR